MTTVEGRTAEQADGWTTRRSTWALWGVAAGVCGPIANMAAQPSVSEADRKAGAEVVDLLTRAPYHVAAIAGFGAVVCLLFLAAGFRRWSERQAQDSLPLRVVPLALLASAGALIASYGVKGQLAAYLDGGFNDATYQQDGLYTYFLLDDLAGFFSWWGVAVAFGCIAWISFRERLVVRWVGALAALGALVPVLFLLVFGFTGFAGVASPVLLVPIGIGLALRRE
jgi:hypothetical protein